MNFETFSAYGVELKELLQLEGHPVAIKLIPVGQADEITGKFDKLDRMMRHCQITDHVRHSGETFYTTIEEHQCKGGAAALGLTQLPEKVRTGEFYCDGLKQFENVAAAKETIDQVTFLKPFSTSAVVYGPLDGVKFDPDVVIFICKPKQAMLLTQGFLFKDGGRIHSEFSGKQSVCSDAVAQVLTLDRPNLTIGCSGSRSYAKIMDEELLFSMPIKDLEKTVSGLRILIENTKKK